MPEHRDRPGVPAAASSSPIAGESITARAKGLRASIEVWHFLIATVGLIVVGLWQFGYKAAAYEASFAKRADVENVAASVARHETEIVLLKEQVSGLKATLAAVDGKVDRILFLLSKE